MNVAELIQLLQELDLPEAEIDELTQLLTTEGVTEPVRRRLRATMMNAANQEVASLEKYEKAYDILKARDQKVAEIKQRTDQAVNRADMRTRAKLEVLHRHVNEDVAAAKAGATLLLHTDDVAPTQTDEASAAPALSPKQAAAVAIEAARRPSTPVSPISMPPQPSSPSMPSMPRHEPLPATMAPLPPTPIAPPSVT